MSAYSSNTLLIGDRVWVKSHPTAGTRHPGTVIAINASDKTVEIKLDNDARVRVFQGLVTLRETHE